MFTSKNVNRLPAEADVSWEAAKATLGPHGHLSVILPCYRVAGMIADNLRQICATFRGHVPFSIVAVNDGSHDETLARIESMQAEIPELTVVHLDLNQGKGHALHEGCKAAHGSHILFLDADLDLPPYQVCWFFEIMRKTRADIVIGAKRHPRSNLIYPFNRRLISAAYYLLVRMLFGLPVRDTQTGIKLFRREALREVLPRMLVKRFAFDLELLVIANHLGYRIAEAPVVLAFRGPYGCVTGTTIHQILKDTAAIFYRLRILRYYQSLRSIAAPATPPLVSVIVACPGPSPYLNECMDGLQTQAGANFEVLILPDTPTNQKWPDWVREVVTGPRRPAEKRNIGIQEARGEILAFIDDDAAPCREWIASAMPYFEDATTGAVGGPGITPPQDPFRAVMSGRVYANPLVSGRYRCRYVATRVQSVDDWPSCNLFVRKAVIEAVGGFRTDFWPGEDTVLCLDIVKHGFAILYDPRVLVYHHRRQLFLPHLRQIGRYALHRGFFAKRFPATSRRLSYMLPSLFLLGLVAGGAISLIWPVMRPLYVSGLIVYLTLTCLSCVSIERLLTQGRPHLSAWFMEWLGIMTTHLVYGARFIQGVMTRHMPCAKQQFDHVSEPGTL